MALLAATLPFLAETNAKTNAIWGQINYFDEEPITWWRSDCGFDSELGTVMWSKAPVECGPVGMRYVVLGLVCTKDGWEEVRCLTGN